MPFLKFKQLQHETGSWKRVLEFLTDENILLKNRLSEMLKDGLDKTLLNEMENFQSNFINGDVLIGVLRNDVAELDKALGNFDALSEKQRIEIQTRLNKVRNNISTAEKQLRKLTIDFNKFFSEKT